MNALKQMTVSKIVSMQEGHTCVHVKMASHLMQMEGLADVCGA